MWALVLLNADQTVRSLADIEKSLPGNANIMLARQSAERTVDLINAALRIKDPSEGN